MSSCSAEKVFAAVAAELKEAEDMYKAQEAPVRTAVPPGVNPDMARMAQDPEIKKKMKSMSKEERMKLALSMMSCRPIPAPAARSPIRPGCRAALTEWQKVSADVPDGVQPRCGGPGCHAAAAEADRRPTMRSRSGKKRHRETPDIQQRRNELSRSGAGQAVFA